MQLSVDNNISSSPSEHYVDYQSYLEKAIGRIPMWENTFPIEASIRSEFAAVGAYS